MRVRDLLEYSAVLAVVGLLVLRSSPREDGLQDVAGRPLPVLEEVGGFARTAGGGLPALRAARARPLEPGGWLGLAGDVRGLALEDVRVELGEGIELVAGGGELEERVLRLGSGVRAVRGDRILLVSDRARLEEGRVRFPGVVVIAPSSPRERADSDLELGLEALVALLR